MYKFRNCKKKVHKFPYNAMPNKVLGGLKLFQGVIAGSVLDKATRVNFFSEQLRLDVSSANIL